MQEADHTQLQSTLIDELFGKVPGAKKEDIRATVEAEFRKLSDEQKLLSLSETEVELLLAFRQWSQSPGSATGVFHWKKRYGKSKE